MFSRVRRFLLGTLPLILVALSSPADEAAMKLWEQDYMQCTSRCGKDFPFTQHTVPEFASIREACIDGCGVISREVLSGYQRCYLQCKKTFPYLHGTREEFADFQRACVEGCRQIRP